MNDSPSVSSTEYDDTPARRAGERRRRQAPADHLPAVDRRRDNRRQRVPGPIALIADMLGVSETTHR